MKYSNQPGYTSTGQASAVRMSGVDNFNVTSIVQSWGPVYTNGYGFRVWDSTAEGSTATNYCDYYSSDYSASLDRPCLVITYTSSSPTPTPPPTAPPPTATPKPTATPTPTATPIPSPSFIFDTTLLKNTDMSTSLSTLENYLNNANALFMSTFGVKFNMLSSGASSSLNQRTEPTTCTHPYNQICDSLCGDVWNCHLFHHKSAQHLLLQEHSSTRIVLRFVDFATCYYHNSYGHIKINGAATSDDKDALVSCVSSIQLTTTHELSHLIGARDQVCTPGESCVMRYGSIFDDVWCTQCSSDINDYLNN